MYAARGAQIRLYNPREIQMDLDGLSFRDDGGGDAASPPPAQFDLVVANILVGPLIRLAPVRPARRQLREAPSPAQPRAPAAQVLSLAVLEGTGRLCLGGLRRAQLPDIYAAYAPYGVAFESVETQVAAAAAAASSSAAAAAAPLRCRCVGGRGRAAPGGGAGVARWD